MQALVIDGNNLLAIATFALYGRRGQEGRLTSCHGEPTGGVFAMVRMLYSIVSNTNPSSGVVAWDGGKSRHRTWLYKEYKAQRADKKKGEAYQALIKQLPIMQTMTALLGFQNVRTRDVEADDVIYRLTEYFRRRRRQVLVVSSDKDLLQLIDDGCSVWSPVRKKEIDTDNFEACTGFLRWQYIYARAMIGDPSDNIPGVPGIGKKTARKILDAVGDPNGFRQAASGGSKKFRVIEGVTDARVESLRKSAEIIQRNLDLMDLRRAPALNHEETEVWGDGRVDMKKVKVAFEDLGFDSILNEYRAFLGPFVRMTNG